MKRRQAEVSRPLTDPHTTTPLNDLHRPRFLLSGLLTCGVCGGGFTITAKDRYGCARRGRQGTCSNSRGIKRQELERRVLDGLRSSLVTPDLVAEFIAEYQAEWNRLQGERHAAASQRDRQLANVQRRLAGIVEAIERGIITPTTKQRLEELEAEKASLEALPVEAPLPAIHPNLARLYRDKVARLEEELADPEIAAEAKSVLRSLIKTIKVTPAPSAARSTLSCTGSWRPYWPRARPKGTKTGPRWRQFKSRWLRGPATATICYLTHSTCQLRERGAPSQLLPVILGCNPLENSEHEIVLARPRSQPTTMVVAAASVTNMVLSRRWAEAPINQQQGPPQERVCLWRVLGHAHWARRSGSADRQAAQGIRLRLCDGIRGREDLPHDEDLARRLGDERVRLGLKPERKRWAPRRTARRPLVAKSATSIASPTAAPRALCRLLAL